MSYLDLLDRKQKAMCGLLFTLDFSPTLPQSSHFLAFNALPVSAHSRCIRWWMRCSWRGRSGRPVRPRSSSSSSCFSHWSRTPAIFSICPPIRCPGNLNPMPPPMLPSLRRACVQQSRLLTECFRSRNTRYCLHMDIKS